MPHPLLRVAAGAAVMLLIAGCGAERNGVEDLGPDAALEAVQAAVADATAVRVVGTVEDGQNDLALDLTLLADGGATGTITNEGQTITVLAVDGDAWFSADSEFWAGQVGEELAAQLADKYVVIPDSDTSFDGFTDWDTFWGDLLDPDGPVEMGETTEHEGQPAVELVDTTNDSVLLVALEGEPLPLAIIGPDDAGSVSFQQWNDDVALAPPATEDVVDPATLDG